MSANNNEVANTIQPAIPATPAAPPPANALLTAPNFQVGSALANAHPTNVIDFNNPNTSSEILTHTQRQEYATTPRVHEFTIDIEDEVIPTGPLDRRSLTVWSTVGDVTNQEVVDGVLRQYGEHLRSLIDDCLNIDLGPLLNFGDPSAMRRWGGLGQPDAQGVCILKLLAAPAP